SFGLELHLQSIALPIGLLVYNVRNPLWGFMPLLGLCLCCWLLAHALRRRADFPWPLALLGLAFLFSSLGIGSSLSVPDSIIAHIAELRRGSGLLPAGYNLRYLDLSLPLLAGLKLPRVFIENKPAAVALVLSLNALWLFLFQRLLAAMIRHASRQPVEALPELPPDAPFSQ